MGRRRRRRRKKGKGGMANEGMIYSRREYLDFNGGGVVEEIVGEKTRPDHGKRDKTRSVIYRLTTTIEKIVKSKNNVSTIDHVSKTRNSKGGGERVGLVYMRFLRVTRLCARFFF